MNKLSKEQVQDVCKLYQQGKPSTELGKMFNVSCVAICGLLKRRGIILRDNGSQKYNCNYNFFETIDSEEKAYWLGFISADGAIVNNSLAIVLAEYETTHLNKFKKAIDATHLVKTYSYPNLSFVKIYIRSQKIVDDLSKYGVIQNKSFSIQFPEIPNSLIRHYIRGVVDGDGCFTSYKDQHNFQITTNRIFALEIQKILMKECSLKQTQFYSRHNNEIVDLRYGGNKQVARIHNYLYSNCSVALERKQNYFNAAKNIRGRAIVNFAQSSESIALKNAL